jgi:hypothetical protein
MTRDEEIAYRIAEGEAHPRFDECWDFLNANPDLLDDLIRRYDEAKKRGRTKIGVALFIEDIRWNYYEPRTYEIVSAKSGRVRMIDQSFAPLIARAIIAMRPDLFEAIEFRDLPSVDPDDVDA